LNRALFCVALWRFYRQPPRVSHSASNRRRKAQEFTRVSASIAVQVQVSPSPSTGFFIAATFFALAPVKLQISSTLNPFGLHATNLGVMESRAEAAGVLQELGNRVDGHIRQPRDRAHRGAFWEHGEDLGALGDRKLVHAERGMNFLA